MQHAINHSEALKTVYKGPQKNQQKQIDLQRCRYRHDDEDDKKSIWQIQGLLNQKSQ